MIAAKRKASVLRDSGLRTYETASEGSGEDDDARNQPDDSVTTCGNGALRHRRCARWRLTRIRLNFPFARYSVYQPKSDPPFEG